MDDPRLDPLPRDHAEAARALARDYAYGVMQGDWLPDAVIYTAFRDHFWQVKNRANDDADNRFDAYVAKKWGDPNNLPDSSYLALFGYFTQIEEGEEYVVCRITEKALNLLIEPALPPQTFIAYFREQSSAFALLIESRLKERKIGAFIDKQISVGDDWSKTLETTIKERVDFFICLIAPGSIDRVVIQHEILWALETRAKRSIRLIPIWHNGFTERSLEGATVDPAIREFITGTNAIKISEESAQSYETALSLLLNRLEYH